MESLELKNFYKNKKVFVTGHTGFKGSWLICFLHKLGAKVCGYSLEPYTDPNMFSLIHGENLVEHHIGDIRDYDHLFAVMKNFQPEIVIHLAAQPIVLTSYENPKYTYETNVMGTVNLFEAIRHIDSIRSVVNVTTDKVYLNNDSGKAFEEGDPLCGYDPYSNSKSCSELVTYSYQNSFFNKKDFGKHHVAISTCRAGNVIGGGDWSDYRLVPDCVKSILKGEPVIIRNPHSTRPFQHVLEPLYLYLKVAMLQYNDINYMDNYNIGPEIENCVSVKEIMDYFVQYEPKAKYVIQHNENAMHEASKLTLDITKIKRKLNYKIIYSIKDTIKTIVDWTNEYISGKDMRKVTENQIDDFLHQIDIKYKKEK